MINSPLGFLFFSAIDFAVDVAIIAIGVLLLLYRVERSTRSLVTLRGRFFPIIVEASTILIITISII